MPQDEKEQPAPPPIPAGNWERPPAPSPPPEVLLNTLIKQLNAHERRKWSWGLLLTLTPVPIALAVAAWFVGGGTAWEWITGVTGLLLLAVIVTNLEAVSSRDLYPREFFLGGFFLVCWLLWAAVGFFFPVTTVCVKYRAPEDDLPFPLRVSYKGEVRFEGQQGREQAFQIRGRLRSSQLQVETLSPLGWTQRSFANEDGTVWLGTIPTTTIYLDNLDHKETQLGCGKLTLTGAASRKQTFRIPALPPRSRCPLTLDGKEIGALDDRNVLVDVLGTRSYRLRTVSYGDAVTRFAARLPQPNAEPQDDTVHFRTSYLHTLPGKIDYFLEPSPKDIQVRTIGPVATGTETRTELLGVP